MDDHRIIEEERCVDLWMRRTIMHTQCAYHISFGPTTLDSEFSDFRPSPATHLMRKHNEMANHLTSFRMLLLLEVQVRLQ